VKRFSEGRQSVTDEEKSGGQQQAELKKILQTFPILYVRIVGYLSGA